MKRAIVGAAIMALLLSACGVGVSHHESKSSRVAPPSRAIPVQSATADTTIQTAMSVVGNYLHTSLQLAVGEPLPHAGTGTEAATVQDSNGELGLLVAQDMSSIEAIPNPLGAGDKTVDVFTRQANGTFSHASQVWHGSQKVFNKQASTTGATGAMVPAAYHRSVPAIFPQSGTGCPPGTDCCATFQSDLISITVYPGVPYLQSNGAIWCNFYNLSTIDTEIENGYKDQGVFQKAGGGVSCCGNYIGNIIVGYGPCHFVWLSEPHWAKTWAWVVPIDPSILPDASAVGFSNINYFPCDYPHS